MKKKGKVAVINTICLVIMAMICSTTAATKESPQYTIIHTDSDFEIRLYQTSVWISTPAVNIISFEKATWNGFHRLFQFTEGANLNFSRIPITSPVLTTLVPGSGPLESQGYYVSLYLPEKFQANPPVPLPELNIESYEFDSHCVAVRKFSGVAKDERIVKEAEKLDKSLSKSEWSESKIEHGGYSIAQYKYSPFRFAKRRNEVWVDIHAPQLGCNDVRVAAY
ncbi:heme-binding protein 2-like [Trifolium pratense]|uniref:heme-binding protein 2-like n=1 Tax=Trifolium pratense TaxID=57577 RepID=UPI001E691EDC|nr:heme-binding protein 2-like [Trifolium pratense]